MNVLISVILCIAGFVAFTFTVLCACGVMHDRSFKRRWSATAALSILTICLFISSYLVFPKCPNCNTTQDSAFCTQCGTQIQERHPTCPTCDVEIKTAFCGTCGHDMRGE